MPWTWRRDPPIPETDSRFQQRLSLWAFLAACGREWVWAATSRTEWTLKIGSGRPGRARLALLERAQLRTDSRSPLADECRRFPQESEARPPARLEARLYQLDLFTWAEHQAEFLRRRDWDAVDLENVSEEIEGLARNERRVWTSLCARAVQHLLKLEH